MKTRRIIQFAVPSMALVAVLAAACFGPDSRSLNADPPREAGPFSLKPDETRIVKIFREVSPSVVFISSSVYVQRGLFSRNIEEMPYGTGSGFIWDKQGHIVTNYHVVKDYVERKGRGISLSVTLEDGKEYKVEKIVGVFMDKEIAVLRIAAPPEKLTPIPIGSSKDLQVGQTALAIGNPFGLDRTLTVGIVSALGREIRAMTGRRIADVIQTDAAINPGNSGGPLLNSSGQFIGINTAILSPSGTSAGIGFAIPGDIVRRYVDQMIRNNGRVTGAGLGIRPFPDSAARRVGLTGVLVDYVKPKTAAARAGIRGTRFYTNGTLAQIGDVIVGIDDTKITDYNSLRDALETHKAGDTVSVTIIRDGKKKKVSVKLQEIEF